MILESFKTLLGNGRAWLLRSDNIQNVIQSLLKPMYDLREIGKRISFTPFPTKNFNAYNIENDLTNWENQFDISTPSTVIKERALRIETQWGMIGGQGYKYIENALISAGLPVRIIENLPLLDVSSSDRVQYGNNQFGAGFEYGQSGYKVIGNGTLNIEGTIKDPVILNNSKSTFFIECSSVLTGTQYEILVDILLRTKPLQTVCIIKT